MFLDGKRLLHQTIGREWPEMKSDATLEMKNSFVIMKNSFVITQNHEDILDRSAQGTNHILLTSIKQ